jgi:hypothetical protein
MRRTLALVVGGVSVGVVLLGWGLAAGVFVPQPEGTSVFYLAGEVLEVEAPGGADLQPELTFTVGSSGGTFLGAVDWNYGSAAFLLVPYGSFVGCPAELGTPTYEGSPWSQSWNQTLGAGEYSFGALCGGYANATVTQAIEFVPA